MRKKGFTFLETLVVLAIFSLILPLVLSILFVIMKQQLRIFALSEVKRQGDYIITYLEDSIANNAYTLYDSNRNEVCGVSSITSDPQAVRYFRNSYNSEFSLEHNYPDLIFEFDQPILPAPTLTFQKGTLNTSKTRIETFNLTCIRTSSFSAPLLSVGFNICYDFDGTCISPDPQSAVSLNYQTNIKLRSYPTE